jgi:hypothetical protein
LLPWLQAVAHTEIINARAAGVLQANFGKTSRHCVQQRIQEIDANAVSLCLIGQRHFVASIRHNLLQILV